MNTALNGVSFSRQRGVHSSELTSVASSSGRANSHASICTIAAQGSLYSRRPSGLRKPCLLAQRRGRTICTATTRQQRRKQPAEADGFTTEGEDEDKDTGFFASGAALVNTLLFGAASRIERGTSVCVSCRGTGTMICKECDATGIVKAMKSSSRDSGNRMKSLVGTKSREKEFIVSNRCRNCRGHGRLECPHCDGIGKRNVIHRDDWM